MSEILNELATIEVSNDVLQQLNLGDIYKSFATNYRKLDELKKFRDEYEKKNRIMRWWHNDKLRDAQLDSAEVQAEFSKTIGQLMMLSIMQSKRLSEQQTQLNAQQGKLKEQADGIAEHAAKLQQQHHDLAVQSEKLEKLVNEYFHLKGLTADGAQKLIEIAGEVKATKKQMLDEFAVRANEIETMCNGLQYQLAAQSVETADQIRSSDERLRTAIQEFKHDTAAQLSASESVHMQAREVLQQNIEHGMAQLERRHSDEFSSLHSAHAAFSNGLSNLSAQLKKHATSSEEQLGELNSEMIGLSARTKHLSDAVDGANTELGKCVQQQQTAQATFATFQLDISRKLRLLGYASIALSIAVVGSVAWRFL